MAGLHSETLLGLVSALEASILLRTLSPQPDVGFNPLKLITKKGIGAWVLLNIPRLWERICVYPDQASNLLAQGQRACVGSYRSPEASAASRPVGIYLSAFACRLPALPVEVSIWVIKWEVHICGNENSQRNTTESSEEPAVLDDTWPVGLIFSSLLDHDWEGLGAEF